MNEELNRAWAFVVSPDFLAEALALRDKMVTSMGFNALEAAQAVLPTTEPLFDHGPDLFNQTQVQLTDLVITLPAAVDMSRVSLPATARLVQHGKYVQVICRNDVMPADAAAMVAALPEVHQERVAQAFSDHSAMVTMTQAASTRRIPFAPLPQMVMLFDGAWQLVESQTLSNIAGFSLLGEAVTGLPTYDPQDTARLATLDITDKQQIQIELESKQLALDGVSTAITELDLLTDLANEVRTEYTVPGELDG